MSKRGHHVVRRARILRPQYPPEKFDLFEIPRAPDKAEGCDHSSPQIVPPSPPAANMRRTLCAKNCARVATFRIDSHIPARIACLGLNTYPIALSRSVFTREVRITH